MNDEKQGTSSLPMEFQFSAHAATVHVEIYNGVPWFVAADVCSILGLDDVRQALYKLEEDEKLTGKLYRSGQTREVWLVNESGLYNLIFRSNKPEARRFRKWVTSEVLPAIRKTGSYRPGSSPAQLALFGEVPTTLDDAYRLVRRQEHNSHTWLSAPDLLALTNRRRSGGRTRLYHQMLAAGTACKLTEWGKPHWYIRQDAVPQFCGVRPTRLLREAISRIHPQKEGGAQ